MYLVLPNLISSQATKTFSLNILMAELTSISVRQTTPSPLEPSATKVVNMTDVSRSNAPGIEPSEKRPSLTRISETGLKYNRNRRHTLNNFWSEMSSRLIRRKRYRYYW